MSGLMELLGELQEPQVIEAIIPTVAIPFLLVGAILSSIATAIAAWFGVELKANGPKRLLEVLLRPKVLIAAIILNAVIFGAYKGGVWIYHSSKPAFIVKSVNWWVAKGSDRVYANNWRLLGDESAINQNNIALSNENIRVAWETKLPKSSFRSLSLSGDSAFAGSLDGFIYELDRKSGEMLRRFYIGKPSVPRPIVFNGVLFVGEGEHATHRSRILAFDLKTGELKGYIQTKGHTEGDIVIVERNGRHMMFAAAGQDGLYAIDPEKLEVIWHSPITHFDSAVVVSSDGKLFASTAIEKGVAGVIPAIQALDIDTGKLLWRTDVASSGWSRPVLVGEKVCVGLGEIYSPAKYGQLACFNQATGESVWAINFAAPVFDTPQISRANSNYLITSDFKGTICSIDIERAQKHWCVETPQKGPFFAVMTQDHLGRILVPSTQGVHFLDPATGKDLMLWKPEGWKRSYAGVTIGSDGLYLMSGDGIARRLELGSNSLAEAK